MARKNEKPAVTISLLRRQLTIAQATIKALQMDRTDKEAIIAGFDSQLAEANEKNDLLTSINRSQAQTIAQSDYVVRQQSTRLAYLEGYHAKSQETASTLLPSGSVFVRDQPQAHTRSSSGDASHIPNGRSGCQGAGQEGGTARSAAGFGDQVRRQRPDHQRNQARPKVEHIEIAVEPLTEEERAAIQRGADARQF